MCFTVWKGTFRKVGHDGVFRWQTSGVITVLHGRKREATHGPVKAKFQVVRSVMANVLTSPPVWVLKITGFFFSYSPYRALQFNYYNSARRMHTVLLQYITIQQLLQFLGPHWPTVREREIVQNTCTIPSACSCCKELSAATRWPC